MSNSVRVYGLRRGHRCGIRVFKTVQVPNEETNEEEDIN